MGRQPAAVCVGASRWWAGRVWVVCVALSLGGAVSLPVHAVRAQEPPLPDVFQGVTIDEHLGTQVDLDLTFRGGDGQPVRLRDFVSPEHPVLLTLNYYECPSVCTVMLNGLVEGLRQLDVSGSEFRVVTVSIDPDEGPALARQKQAAYHRQLGRDDIRWDFLVGAQPQIQQLADEVGFRYRYDPDSDQFAHVPAVFFLSPDGHLSRYLYGLTYTARDLKFALMDASEGKIGSTIDRILSICFHFVDGTYAPFAFGIMRLGGILVVTALGIFLFVLWRRERQQRRAEAA